MGLPFLIISFFQILPPSHRKLWLSFCFTPSLKVSRILLDIFKSHQFNHFTVFLACQLMSYKMVFGYVYFLSFILLCLGALYYILDSLLSFLKSIWMFIKHFQIGTMESYVVNTQQNSPLLFFLPYGPNPLSLLRFLKDLKKEFY